MEGKNILKNFKFQVVLATSFSIIGILLVFLLFNNYYFNTQDIHHLNIRFIMCSICIAVIPTLFLGRYGKKMKFWKIFLISLSIQVILLLICTFFNFGLFLDVELNYKETAIHILNGDYSLPWDLSFTNYEDNWRIFYPPLAMYYFSFSYILHSFNPFFWRFQNILFNLGILFIIYKIGKLLNIDEKYLTNGLLFYSISFPSLLFGIIWGDYDLLVVLLCLIGIYFTLKEYKDPQNSKFNLPLSGIFFALAMMIKWYPVIWIYSVGLILLWRRKFKELLYFGAGVVITIVLLSLWFFIQQPLGFTKAFFWFLFWEHTPSMYTTIWHFPNAPILITALPFILILFFTTILSIKLDTKDLDHYLFLVIIAIFIIFSTWSMSWIILWFLPLIHIPYLITPEKTKKVYYFLYLYLYLWFLLLGIAFIYFDWGIIEAGGSLYNIIGVYLGLNLDVINQIVVNGILYLGLIYVIYSVLKAKQYFRIEKNDENIVSTVSN